MQREKIQTEPVSECIWWQSKRAETEVGATEEQTSALLQSPGWKRFLWIHNRDPAGITCQKNTFCCGDKIPILVHTCDSTERNYAFLFYYKNSYKQTGEERVIYPNMSLFCCKSYLKCIILSHNKHQSQNRFIWETLTLKLQSSSET